MPWLKSGNHSYFHLHKVVDGKQVAIYLGNGPEAIRVSKEVEQRKQQRAKVAALRRRDKSLDLEYGVLVGLINDAISAELVPRGYRPYGTQWAIVGRGRKSPRRVSNVDSSHPGIELVSSLATSLCDQVIGRLEDEPERAARLRRELDKLRADLTVNAGLEKLMIEQVLVAHAINMVAMWEESRVPPEDLYASERHYWTQRANRTSVRLCRSVKGLMGLLKLRK